MTLQEFNSVLSGATSAFDNALTTYNTVTSSTPKLPGYTAPAPNAAGAPAKTSFFGNPLSMLFLALAGAVLVVATVLAFRKRRR